MPIKRSSRGSGIKRGDDPLTLEQKRLLAQQEELLRAQERARRVIEEAPRKLKKIKQRQRAPIRLDLRTASTAAPRISAPDKWRDARAVERTRRPRRAERNQARLQFVALCVILAVILFLLWTAI